MRCKKRNQGQGRTRPQGDRPPSRPSSSKVTPSNTRSPQAAAQGLFVVRVTGCTPPRPRRSRGGCRVCPGLPSCLPGRYPDCPGLVPWSRCTNRPAVYLRHQAPSPLGFLVPCFRFPAGSRRRNRCHTHSPAPRMPGGIPHLKGTAANSCLLDKWERFWTLDCAGPHR